jgi:nucleoside-diphosphate-sugar epimerase
MKKIIINGANGFVASSFITKLLSQHYQVNALVRAGNNSSSSQRMYDVLSEMNEGKYVNSNNLKVYNYSLLEENFSIPENQLETIFSCNVDYFHFAASLKYDVKSKNKIFETNLKGLENSINVFSRYANCNSRFFFISTAYSCGNFEGVFQEKFYENEEISRFRNYYEQSKRFAENIVKKHIDTNGLNGHIIRLSQVIGNSKSGVTKTDYGIFDFAKRIHNLANRYPYKTVRVHVDPESTQNLIPIDTVTDYLMRTIKAERVPVIMNFIAKNSIRNICIINSISKLLPIQLSPVKTINREEMDTIERMVSAGMSFTGSYINTNLLFGTEELDKVMLSVGNEAHEQAVYQMLAYYIDNLSKKRSNVLKEVR